MKKILLTFVIMVIFYLAYPGLSASAAGSLWNRAMSGSVVYDESGNSFDLIINSIDIDSDEWGVFVLDNGLDRYISVILVSTVPFSGNSFYRFLGNTSSNYSFTSTIDGEFYIYEFIKGGDSRYHFLRSSDFPVFHGDLQALESALQNQDPNGFVSIPGPNVDSGTYDKDLGYLIGISERSSILDIRDDKNESSSLVPPNRIFKIGWSSATSSGVELSSGVLNGVDRYDDLMIQPKIKLRGFYTNIFTHKISRSFPDTELYELDSLKAYDPYSFSFDYMKDLNLWFLDFLTSVQSDCGVLEKQVVNADLYMRLFATDHDSGDLVVGPWVKLSFSVITQEGFSDSSVHFQGGVDLDDSGNLSVDPSSPYGDGVFDDFGIGTGVNYEAANNNVERPSSDYMNKSFESLMSDVGNLPSIISKLFSFLPSWCLNLFAVAFSLSIVILLWKVAT